MANSSDTNHQNGTGKDHANESSPLLPESKFAPKPNIWQRLTFQWFTPILKLGNEKDQLEQDDLDLVPLPESCKTDAVHSRFEYFWQDELTKSSPSLIRALFRAFGRDYLFAGLLKCVHDVSVFVGPITLNNMVKFMRNPDAPITVGLAWTVAVTCSQILMSICLRHYFFQCYQTGLRIRTALAVAVYRKALKLAAHERQTRSSGEITNLMSIDAQRLQDLTTYLHSLWSSPLQIALALFFLWKQLGPSSLGGVSVIVIMIPITKAIASWMGQKQKDLMKLRDRRTDLNGEILSSMRIVKFQAWEKPFFERIQSLRQLELQQLLNYAVATSFSRMMWVFTPLAVALSTFATYVWLGNKLDVATALTSLTLFDILRFPLFMLPQIINNTVEAMVSLNRVRSFLLCDDYKPVEPGDLQEVGVELKKISAVYDSRRPKELTEKEWKVTLLQSQLQDAEDEIQLLSGREVTYGSDHPIGRNPLCLRRIDFSCRPGELVAVVGSVGSSKSSLLGAILGEVTCISGTAEVNGSLAYFQQSPFIMNASVRDNILFGHINESIDEERYERAIECCALRRDLDLLPNGEHTEIGERGITLSGGQKARIALARVVYHQAEISVVDDALSAVDAHVGKAIFEEAIVGDLLKSVDGKKRCVVLVTNALEYLKHPSVSRVVVLGEGRIVETGTYYELSRRKDSRFAQFLSVISDPGSGSLGARRPSGSETLNSTAVTPLSSIDNKTKPTKSLMTEETRSKGIVGAGVYFALAEAAGGKWLVPFSILFVFTSAEAIQFLANWWLTFWSSHGSEYSQFYLLSIYAMINCSYAVAGLLRMLLVTFLGYRASRKLFSDMLSVVLEAPMAFFDTTPIGRLLNRFSKDIYTLDEQLLQTLRSYLMTLFTVFSTICVISGVTPIFAVCLLPMILFYITEQRFFTSSYRELKRLDSINRSPLYALLGETIDGVSVIRAFGAEPSLFSRLISMFDSQQHAYFLTFSAQSWLAVRLELVGTCIVTFTCLSAVTERLVSGSDEAFAGLAGLAISYALSVTQSLNWSVRMASDMEANMVAVERILEYTALPSEGAKEMPEDQVLQSTGWPKSGEIKFSNVEMKYRPELPLTLKGLDIRIPPSSKVGVVGRTGAGKSSLMVALMRIVELNQGQITIDDVDTSKIGLATLRKTISVIPQDPCLFSGTIRDNLDPFSEYNDDELFKCLEAVGLSKGIMSSGHSTLSSNNRIESVDDVVSEGGSNLSLGQRQLIVIARALLSKNQIVIMDEATASVDAETDAMIQSVFRTEFAEATCITIAHRLNTIMDSDYILVMDDGKAVEFDSPNRLMRKGGMFRDLVRASGSPRK